MYNPLLHKERGLARTLPRPPGWRGVAPAARPQPRSRSKSPGRAGRPQLSLVLCPDYCEYPEGMREYSPASPLPGSPRTSRPASPRHFPFSAPLPVPHALARTRGAEHAAQLVLRDSASLPCSPVWSRLGRGPPALGRELSLPSSPVLPRIHIQDYDPATSEVQRQIVELDLSH